MYNMAFITAVSQYPTAKTANGALSHHTPGGAHNARLNLFYKAIRGLDSNEADLLYEAAAREDATDAVVLAFHIRDCRGGRGERALGRQLLGRAVPKSPIAALIARGGTPVTNEADVGGNLDLLRLVPEYGRWDDLLALHAGRPDQVNAVLWAQLRTDQKAMAAGQPVSLCAKWMPTEKHSFDRGTGFVAKFCRFAGIKPRQYRKMLSELRKHIDVVERRMCAGEWGTIDFSKVPSCAMHRLKDAMREHDPQRFAAWEEGLATGATKVNSGQLFPYQLIHELDSYGSDQKLIEAQWAGVLKGYSSLERTIAVCDVSGSMKSKVAGFVSAMDVCISLGLLVAELGQGEWRNKVITFSREPVFVDLSGSLSQRYHQLRDAQWAMNTDLQATFDLILAAAVRAKVPAEEMPLRMLIISDMQFDSACTGRTNFEVIADKYRSAGYDMPHLVFWNVTAGSGEVPIKATDFGALVSGFSPAVLKFIHRGGTPVDMLRDVLDSDRYAAVKKALKG